MTKLILSAFDPAAPGSFMERQRLLELVEEWETAREEGKPGALARLARRMSELVLKRLRTDDGTPVEDALELLSANEYDELAQGLLTAGGSDNVPLASTEI